MAIAVLSLGIGAFLLGLFLLYRAALPQPIPGIPYVNGTANSPLGNIPHAFAHKAKTGRLSTYFSSLPTELNAPLVQLFMQPFGKPWLILSDAREAQDVMLRRSREFELSDFYIDIHRAAWPNSQAALKSNERWRANRRMLAESLSPQSLRTFGLDAMYDGALELLEVLRRKLAMVEDSVLDIKPDLRCSTADVIWQFQCGEPLGALRSQLDGLDRMTKLDQSALSERLPNMLKALEIISASSQIPVDSPLGYTHHWLALKTVSEYRNAVQLRDSTLRGIVTRAVKDFGKPRENSERSALALMLKRLEQDKFQTVPAVEIDAICAELALIAHAGQKTVADTLAWILKYAAAYPYAQDQIRSSLKEYFVGHRAPPKELVANANLPHLDAFIHEVLRVMPVVPAHIRVATVDTQILGHFVPKGTDVFMPPVGPSYTLPAFPVDDILRSTTSNTSTVASSPAWQQKDLPIFRPERWLKKNEQSGDVKFNGRTAPMMAFSEGPRACFGTRFALSELRVLLIVLLWNFKIECPDNDAMGFEAIDFLTIEPKNAMLKLTRI